jgi:hypothetical protein
MSIIKCKGFVILPDNTVRPCRNTGGAVLGNGYCVPHQNIAAQEIIKQIGLLEKELTALQGIEHESVDLNQVSNTKKDIADVKTYLQEVGALCVDDPKCEAKLNKISVGIEGIISPEGVDTKLPTAILPSNDGQLQYQDPFQNLRSANINIENLSQLHKGDAKLANDVTKQESLSSYQLNNNDRKISSLQSKIIDNDLKSNELETKLKKEWGGLSNQLNKTVEWKKNAVETQRELQTELSNCHARGMELTGKYAENINRSNREVEYYKSLYNTAVGREIKDQKNLELLADSESDIKDKLQELQSKHQIDIQNLHKFYSTRLQNGETIKTENEKKMESDIMEYKRLLELSEKSLRTVTDNGKAALEYASSTNKPAVELAADLVETNNRLKKANEQYMEAQSNYDTLMEQKVNAQLECENRSQKDHEKSEMNISELNQQLANSYQELTDAKKSINEMRTELATIKNNAKHNIDQIKLRLGQANSKLRSQEANAQHHQNQLQEHKRLTETSYKHKITDFQFKQSEEKKQLEMIYEAKKQQLEYQSKQKENERATTEARLRLSTHKLTELKEKAQHEITLNRNMKEDFERKTAELNKQQMQLQQLQSDLKAQLQSSDFREKEYKLRVAQTEQRLQLTIQAAKSKTQDLKFNLKEALQAKTAIENTLQECKMVRQSIILRTKQLNDENTKLKQELLNKKKELEVNKSHYEHKIRQFQAQQRDTTVRHTHVASQLANISDVHAHVQKEYEKCKEWRTQTQNQVQKTKEQEQALNKLNHVLRLSNQEKVGLQNKIQSLQAQGEVMQNSIKNTNSELRNLKKINQDLAQVLEDTSHSYKEDLILRDASMIKDKMHIKSKEEAIKAKLEEQYRINKGLSNQLDKSQKQKTLTENTLMNTVVNNAVQVESLIGSNINSGRNSINDGVLIM